MAVGSIVLNFGRPRLGEKKKKKAMMYIVLNFRRPRIGGKKSDNGLDVEYN